MNQAQTGCKENKPKVSGIGKFIKDPLRIFRQLPPPASAVEVTSVVLRNTVLDLVSSLQREDNALEELIGRLTKQQASTRNAINQISRLHPNAAHIIKQVKDYPDIELEKAGDHV